MKTPGTASGFAKIPLARSEMLDATLLQVMGVRSAQQLTQDVIGSAPDQAALTLVESMYYACVLHST